MAGEVAVKGGLELLGELEREGAISTTGLHLSDPDMPFDQFEALCRLLGKMHHAVRFAIGDALMLGEQLYGEEAHQAFEALELSEAGRAEYLRVSQQVPRSRRRKDLSWSHHRAVASLAPDEQKGWLKWAAENAASHHQLRDALRQDETEAREVCPACGRPL